MKIADLQEHYKTSPCHPICPICGIGVKDARDLHELHSSSEAAAQHQREAHAVAPQGGGVLAEDKVIGDVVSSIHLPFHTLWLNFPNFPGTGYSRNLQGIKREGLQ